MAFQLVFAKQNYPESLEVTRQKKQGAKTRHKQKQQANKKKTPLTILQYYGSLGQTFKRKFETVPWRKFNFLKSLWNVKYVKKSPTE